MQNEDDILTASVAANYVQKQDILNSGVHDIALLSSERKGLSSPE